MSLNITRRTIVGILASDLESSNVELRVDFELATGWSGWEGVRPENEVSLSQSLPDQLFASEGR
jgi:hypothetical protein